jgi:hypothetical protein
VLQEILDLNALQSLATRLGFHHFAASPDGRGNRVAFLTRNPPVQPPLPIVQWRLAPGVQVRDFGAGGAVAVWRSFRARPFRSASRTAGASSTSSPRI